MKKSPPKAPERVQKRYQVALPVRITYWDKDKKPVLEMACTYDISPRGARITSVKAIKQTGEIVVLERGESKAFCRVVWVGDSASAWKDQIGLETIEANQTMWPAELKAMQDVFDSLTWEEPEKIKEKGADKRRQHRFSVTGIADVELPGKGKLSQKAAVKDLSEMGCLLQTKEALKPGASIKLTLKIGDCELTLKGLVRRSLNAGFGIEFSEIRKGDRQMLKHALQKLAEQQLNENIELEMQR